MLIKIGNTIIRCGGGTNWAAYWSTPTERDSVVLDTLNNTKYNTYPSLAQDPNNHARVILTYIEADSHVYSAAGCVKMRISMDGGKTFGTATTILSPTGTMAPQEQQNAYTSDGRLHVLAYSCDDTNVRNLTYLYSDNNGSSFTEVDLTSLVADGTLPIFASNQSLIVNNGVLMGTIYNLNAGATSSRRSILRLVTGTWTKVDVETTSAYENEASIVGLGGNNLMMLVRSEVAPAYSYVQHLSTDNGLNWTRLGTVDFGIAVADNATSPFLYKFAYGGADYVVCYFNRQVNGANHPLYACYAKASDLLTLGVYGWKLDTIKAIITAPDTNHIHKQATFLHYNNDYNAICCATYIYMPALVQADLITFEINTTDTAAQFAKLQNGFAYSSDLLFARMVTAGETPVAARKTLLDTAIRATQALNIWDNRLDAIYAIAGHGTVTAKLNILKAAYSLLEVNAPTFTTDRGYKGDAVSARLNTTIVPSSGGYKYVQDSAMIMFYARVAAAENKATVGSQGTAGVGNTCVFCRWNDDAAYAEINGGTETGIANAVGNGLYTLVRDSATTWKFYKDKTKTDKTSNSTGLPPLISLLSFNVDATYIFSANEVSFFAIGAKITPTEQGLLYDIWVDGYLAAVGAKV